MGNTDEKDKTRTFAIDSDTSGGAEMPGVTRLLNRKSLKGVGKPGVKPSVPAAAPPTPSPSFSPSPFPPASSAPSPESPETPAPAPIPEGLAQFLTPAAPAAEPTPQPKERSNSRIELNSTETSLATLVAPALEASAVAASMEPTPVSNSRIELNLKEKSLGSLIAPANAAASEGIQIEGLENSETAAAASASVTPSSGFSESMASILAPSSHSASEPPPSAPGEGGAAPFEIKIDPSGLSLSGDGGALEIETSQAPSLTPSPATPQLESLLAPAGTETPPAPSTFDPSLIAPASPSLASLLENSAPSGGEALELAVQTSEVSAEDPPPPAMIESQTQLLKVLRATPRKRAVVQPLILWEPAQLVAGKDPLGKGIAKALKKGATSALYLAIEAPAPGTSVPRFMATAAVTPGLKLNLWTGLKWDPMLVPELWNFFVRSGIVELGPPGELTNQLSNRNVIRSGLGLGPKETLLLVRAGPANGCRGVVAFVSNTSLLLQMDEALALIYEAPQKAA